VANFESTSNAVGNSRMNKPFIFVSCGQYTQEEKSLGKSIVQVVKNLTGLDAFFAEEVHDLAGLDANILQALSDCSAFITVLHPRGAVVRPNRSEHIRASVWIEQEIAIATYIQRAEQRPLPVIAFIHRSVGLEGLRSLIHLNPIVFSNEMEILTALPALLQPWGKLSYTGIELRLESSAPTMRDGHAVRQVKLKIANQTNGTIEKYDGLFRVPAGVLKHWSASYMGEETSDDPLYRRFRFNQFGKGSIRPHSESSLYTTEYCTRCAAEHSGETPAIAGAIVGGAEVEALLWIDGKEYRVVKTIQELSS
jgi:hypothetical protein